VIIDAHHHLWEDLTRRDYAWLADLDAIRRPYTVDELTTVSNADRTILVQTVPTVEETEEFLTTAAATPLIAGVVGWVDLTTPDVPDRLAALQSPKLVGIRHPAQGEPDPEWLTRKEVIRGIKSVAEAGLTYDILIVPAQHQAAIALADAVPGARLVLDHAGKPAIADGAYEPWAEFITELSARPNVFCKLSGLVTEANWTQWTIEDLRPYADQVLTSFGPTRVMFGSDWPVCELAATYPQVYESARTLTSDLTPSEQNEVFAGTATRAYPIAP
jgi:L-fucono-1,5-lactonase